MARPKRRPPPLDPGRQLVVAGCRVFAVAVLVGGALHQALAGVAGMLELELATVWGAAAGALGVHEAVLRLLLFVPLNGVVWTRLQWLWPRIDGFLLAAWRRVAESSLGVRRAALASGGTIAAVMAVGLVVQPTLVPWRVDTSTSLVRAANLADGTAQASLAGSLVGMWRRFAAPPVGADLVVDVASLERDLRDPSVPVMDRWDPLLLAAANGDAALAAETKAFMWVESGGHQFAVSRTGCLGLLQFCTSTAERRPFGAIFGVGGVTSCACDGCSVPKALATALETDPTVAASRPATFPCDLADARFDPERAIRAGVAYVQELRALTGGALPLMYVGYNSGPRVAASLRRALPAGEPVTVEALRPGLATALRPWYGARAEGRARGLLDVHLPKLMAAWERWRPQP